MNLGDPANGDKGNLNTRQHHVGLKGDWGSVWLGAFDSVIVRFGGFSTTDILDQYSGNFEPIYRTSNAVAYVSPNLNGFQFGVEVAAQDGSTPKTVSPAGKDVAGIDCVAATSTQRLELQTVPQKIVEVRDVDGDVQNVAVDGNDCEGNAVLTPSVGDDGNDFDKIGIGASYSIQGLTSVALTINSKTHCLRVVSLPIRTMRRLSAMRVPMTYPNMRLVSVTTKTIGLLRQCMALRISALKDAPIVCRFQCKRVRHCEKRNRRCHFLLFGCWCVDRQARYSWPLGAKDRGRFFAK